MSETVSGHLVSEGVRSYTDAPPVMTGTVRSDVLGKFLAGLNPRAIDEMRTHLVPVMDPDEFRQVWYAANAEADQMNPGRWEA